MILGVTQQIVLVPVFLHFWSSEVLAAWLVIYAAGNLALIADSGLQVRAINRFLAFKSCIDCDGRTANFYVAMLRIYQGLGALLVILLLAVTQVLSPSVVLGFPAVPDFDVAFVLMTAGTLSTLPSGLVMALYRARGHYGGGVWLQNWAMLIAQLAQLAAIAITGSLLAVTIAYAATQLLLTVYLLAIDAPRRFGFLRGAHRLPSPQWIVGQFRKAVPFAVAGATEVALNVPVLLVSALVEDRAAVAQWGLTRIVAGLLRALCFQATLPLAAELGHDYAVGLKQELRSLYARGSVFVTVLASIAVSGLLPFWQDFFALWTHGTVPYDPVLTVTLLIGTSAVAPSFLALAYANYSNRGDILVRTKGLQLVVFLLLSVVADPPTGTAWRCDRGCRKRSFHSIRRAGFHHHEPDVEASAAACRISPGSNGWGHLARLGLGNHHSVMGPGYGTGAIYRRMRALAGDRRSSRSRPVGQQRTPKPTNFSDSELAHPD